MPHVVSFMPDVAATVAAVVTRPEAAGGTWLVPNAPAVTQRQVVAALARAAGVEARVSAVPRAAIALGGLVVPLFRELRETWYQFAEPWTTDSTRTEAALGVRATPLGEGAEVTVAWWRGRLASPSR
jgi:nucleoside-diphosphate-sugar epimerase